jgi:ribosomal protein S18 acetylase RimI-like enzyme
MFGLFEDEKFFGFVAIENKDNGIYEMEKLAVIPEYRHKGYGYMLISFVWDYIRKRGGNKITIGIIDENKMLKKWYNNNGFVETGTKLFPQLPFTVCFMEKLIDDM